LRYNNCNVTEDSDDKAVAFDWPTCMLKVALALKQLQRRPGDSIIEQPVTAAAVILRTTRDRYQQARQHSDRGMGGVGHGG